MTQTQHLRTDNKHKVTLCTTPAKSESSTLVFEESRTIVWPHQSSEQWNYKGRIRETVPTYKLFTLLSVIFQTRSEFWDAPIKSLRQYIRLQARNTTRTAAGISIKSKIWGVLLRCVEPSDLSFRSNSFDEHFKLRTTRSTRNSLTVYQRKEMFPMDPQKVNETHVITKINIPWALRFSRWEKKKKGTKWLII